MARIVKKRRWWDKKAKTGNQIGRKERSPLYNTNNWLKTKEAVLIRDNYLCQECLRKNIYTQLCVRKYDHAVDHIKPVRQGGNFFDMDNLESLCAPCHNSKSGKERWEGEVKG